MITRIFRRNICIFSFWKNSHTGEIFPRVWDPDSRLGIQIRGLGSRLRTGDLDLGPGTLTGALDLDYVPPSEAWTQGHGPLTQGHGPLTHGQGPSTQGQGSSTQGQGFSTQGQGSRLGVWDPDSRPGIQIWGLGSRLGTVDLDLGPGTLTVARDLDSGPGTLIRGQGLRPRGHGP